MHPALPKNTFGPVGIPLIRGHLRRQAINLKAWGTEQISSAEATFDRAALTKKRPTEVHPKQLERQIKHGGLVSSLWLSVDVYLWRRASPLCREYNTFLTILLSVVLYFLQYSYNRCYISYIAIINDATFLQYTYKDFTFLTILLEVILRFLQYC